MKLKREEFDPLRLPGKVTRGRGPKGDPDPRKPIDPDDPSDEEDDGGDDGDGDGDDEGTVNTVPGGMLTPEESDILQRQMGVTVEHGKPGDDEAWTKEAARHVDKLTSNRGGIGGSGNGNLRRLIARLSEPQTDWKAALKRFIGKALSSTESYLGSRRHLYKDDYFYGEKNKYDALDKVAVAIDVTGSVQGDFAEFLSEVAGILQARKIKEIHVLPFAETVHDVVVIKGSKKVVPSDFEHVRLGGGTENITAIKDYVEKTMKNQISFCVIITDGHLTTGLPSPPKADWGKNTIWLVYNNSTFAKDYNFPTKWGTIINAKFQRKQK
jgi:predicted metal-dependent peptidase